MAAIVNRMFRASILDSEVYEEVEADQSATGQASLVVLASALAGGLNTFDNGGFEGLAWGTVAALVGWYIWAYVTYFIGTRFLPTDQTVADHGELLRTIGFSSAPGVLRVFGLIPAIAGWVFFGCMLWMMVAMVVAVRQALDYESTWRAIGVCMIGLPIYLLIQVASLLAHGAWPV